MKAYNESDTRRQHVDTPYSVERELGGRLTVLSGLIGNPHWQTTDSYDRQRIEAAVRRSHRARSRYFTGAVERAARAFAGAIHKAGVRYSENQTLKHNIAELKGLDDRTLQDIGIFRGDIAQIASGEITVAQVNHDRKALGRPALKLVTATPKQAEAKLTADRKIVNLPKEAA